MLPFIGLLFACDRVNYGHGSARTGQESPQDRRDTAAEAGEEVVVFKRRNAALGQHDGDMV